MMSGFLSEPITTKVTSSGKGNQLKYGESGMQGWRSAMEDAHVSMATVPNHPGYSFFGIFDGHGGNLISTNISRILLSHVTKTEEFKLEKTPENIATALKKGFISSDAELRLLPQIVERKDDSGSTGVTTLITPELLLVANAGDSRAVMSCNHTCVQLSYDHKPTNEEEVRRIEASGGSVIRGRVCGGVAVSRGFGDFMFKNTEGLGPEAQAITVVPDVSYRRRDEVQDEFLLLACDGLWDVMSCAEAVEFVWKQLNSNVADPGRICELLLDESFRRSSRDNISAQLILFPAAQAKKKGGGSRACVIA